MSTKTVTIYGISEKRRVVPRTLSQINIDDEPGALTPLDWRNPDEQRYVDSTVPIERFIIDGHNTYFAMTPELRSLMEVWAAEKYAAPIRRVQIEINFMKGDLGKALNDLNDARMFISVLKDSPWYVRLWHAITGYRRITR